MSISDARIRIASAHKDLLAAWWHAEDRWGDQNSTDFARKVMGPIETAVRNAVNGIEKLEVEVQAMRSECELDNR